MNKYTVKLAAFEGPLDLLLELIERDELAISDVSLARITDEFLGYLSRFQGAEPAHLADFLVVAAKLILIKSKTLLPSFEVSKEEEADIVQLKEKLKRYQKVRQAARAIALLIRRKESAYHRFSSLKFVPVFLPPEGVTKETLKTYFTGILQAKEVEMEKYELRETGLTISFEEKIRHIRARLTENLEQSFSAMYDLNEKMHIIISFLAVLELVKQSFLKVEQADMFGEMRIIKLES